MQRSSQYGQATENVDQGRPTHGGKRRARDKMAGKPAARPTRLSKSSLPPLCILLPAEYTDSVIPNPSSPSSGSHTSKHDLPAPRALPQLPRLPAGLPLPGRVAAAVPAPPPRAAAPLRLHLLHRRCHRGAGPRGGGQLLLRRPRPPPRGQCAGDQGRVPSPGARRPPGRRRRRLVRRGLHPRPRGLLHALRPRQARRLRPPPPPLRRRETAHRRSRTLALVPSAPFPPDLGD